MPNWIKSIVQLTGSDISMKRIAEAVENEQEDPIQLIVPIRDDPRGTYDMRSLREYVRDFGKEASKRILTNGSKFVSIDDYHIMYDGDTVKAVTLYMTSAWDPPINWVQNIPDSDVTALIAYGGEMDVYGIRVVKNSQVLQCTENMQLSVNDCGCVDECDCDVDQLREKSGVQQRKALLSHYLDKIVDEEFTNWFVSE